MLALKRAGGPARLAGLALVAVWLGAAGLLLPACRAPGLEYRGESGPVVLRAEPWPPRARTDLAFEVQFRGGSLPVQAGEGIRLVLFMPDMDHGDTAVTLEPAGGGRYRGTGRLDHGGRWVAEVVVGDRGPVARFELVVEP